MARQGFYLLDTRHPWPCLLFLLPLLIAYEAGVLWLGGAEPEALRSGVDAWLRWVLLKFGLRQLYVLPIVVALVFVVWSWLRRKERPGDLGGVLLGMTLESVAFALVLYGACACLNPVLFPRPAEAPPEMLSRATPETPVASEAVRQVVTFVGAGVYEEVVFRLVLFTILLKGLRLIQAPLLLAAGVAAVASAAGFSAVHHFGPFGEPFESGVFVFRMLAGVFFALLFHLRGFGVAVGAHACYDILAGLSS
jgi:membrane protease YdiL (CAAX protease family)